jgi:hypothetical protein
MTFNEPAVVVVLLESVQSLPQLLDRPEGSYPEQVLLEGANESLGTPVAFGLSNEGRRASDPKEPNLLLKEIRHVLAPMVVPKQKPISDLPDIGTKMPSKTLPDRLQGLKSSGISGGVDADTLGGAMVHCHKNSCLAFVSCPCGADICSPNSVHPLSDDGPLVGFGPVGVSSSVGCQESPLPHQPQHPALGRTNSCEAQLGPDFSIPFPMERGLRKNLPDSCHQVFV